MKLEVKRLKQSSLIRTSGLIVGVIACFLLLLGCCMIYTTGSFYQSMQQFIHSCVRTGSLSLIQGESKVIEYLDTQKNRYGQNYLIQLVDGGIPMYTYISKADDIKLNSYIQLTEQALKENEKVKVSNDTVDKFLYYNGNIYGSNGITTDYAANLTSNSEKIGSTEDMLTQESFMEDETTQAVDTAAIGNKDSLLSLDMLRDYETLIKKCYVEDSTIASPSIFQVDQFMKRDFSITVNDEKPQILIYHTHSQETFYDSRKGVVEDSIVGVGEELAQILREQYGIEVIHDTTTYDLLDGELERSLAYNVALPSIEKILEYNPSIEVVIDLHRDGMPAKMDPEQGKRVTTIEGKKCAQIMFFNGLSANKNGAIEYLPNPNLEDNLAFSFQMFYYGKATYPELFRPIYLKPYRFNLHLKERSTLVELGTQYNTVEEAKNSMKYLAETLASVIKGK